MANPELLAEILERTIDPDHSLSHVPLIDRIAALPEKRALPLPSEATLIAAAEQRPASWELPLLLITALIVLAGLAAACYLSQV